jgi:hypothetical protein
MRVFLNPTVDEFQGTIGGMSYRKHKGKQIATKRRKAGVASENQIAVQERFKSGAAYAKYALQDSILGPAYQNAAQLRDKSAFALAVGDYCKRPVVKVLDISEYYGQVGNIIEVFAVDNFGVVGVEVKIKGPSDLEVGSAVESPVGSGTWKYTAQNQLTNQVLEITATAKDRPGGKGSKTASVEIP